MNKTKNRTVQIPLESFLTLWMMLEGYNVSENDYNALKRTVNDKLDALARRELYSKYKTAPTEEEKEQARQKYLNEIGMHQDFRW